MHISWPSARSGQPDPKGIPVILVEELVPQILVDSLEGTYESRGPAFWAQPPDEESLRAAKEECIVTGLEARVSPTALPLCTLPGLTGR